MFTRPNWLPFVVLALSVPVTVLAQESGGQAAAGAGASQGSAVEQLIGELAGLRARIADVDAKIDGVTNAQRIVFEFQRRERWRAHHERLNQLGVAVEQVGLATLDSSIVAFAREALEAELEAKHAGLTDVRVEALDQLDTVSETPPELLVEAEIRFSQINREIDVLMRAIAEDYDLAPALGMNLAEAAAAHDSAMVERAELVSAALEYGHDQVAEFRSWMGKPGVDTVAVSYRISAAEERITGSTASLEAMSGLLERRGIDVSYYRRLVLATTGVITTEVLDTRVLGGLLAQWGTLAREWLIANVGVLVLRLLLIILVLFIAGRAARVARAAARQGVKHLELSSLIKNLVVSGASKSTWVIALFVILSILGIDLGPALAGLGIVGFVVGFALQDTLANFASGLMIMIYRPFDVGDFVTAGGVTGKVKDLTLVSTVIQTLDNKRIMIPNGKVWGDVINNATAERVRRVDMVFGISYSDDVDEARAVLEDVLSEDDRVLADPAPMVRVESLGDSSVNLFCRPWCRTEDYWDLYWDLTRVVKKRFDSEGITFPFPQRDVHVHNEGAPSS